MSPISVFEGKYRLDPVDIVLSSPGQIFAEENPITGATPAVVTCTPEEFGKAFPATCWIINTLGWARDTPRRGPEFPPRRNTSDDLRNLRIIFDVARRTNRWDFEEQIDALNKWCNLRELVTGDSRVYRHLVHMTRTPLLGIMAALYPPVNPRILENPRGDLREFDLGIYALAQVALNGSLPCLGPLAASLPADTPYCDEFLVKEEAIALYELQSQVAPVRLLPAWLPGWYFTQPPLKFRFYAIEDRHVVALLLEDGEWKGPRPETAVFPLLELPKKESTMARKCS